MHNNETSNQRQAAMPSMPVAMNEVASSHEGLNDFRLSSRAEITGLLKQLRDANVTLNLNAPDGRMLNVTLCAIAATHDAHLVNLDSTNNTTRFE